MADKLYVTVFTINQHLKKIYQKLNVASKSELISKIWSNNLFSWLLIGISAIQTINVTII